MGLRLLGLCGPRRPRFHPRRRGRRPAPAPRQPVLIPVHQLLPLNCTDHLAVQLLPLDVIHDLLDRVPVSDTGEELVSECLLPVPRYCFRSPGDDKGVWSRENIDPRFKKAGGNGDSGFDVRNESGITLNGERH